MKEAVAMAESSRVDDGVILGCRSWLYLMLNFVLGSFYFYALIVGFVTSIALSIILVGIPLLAGMFWATRQVAALDRWLACRMLGVQAARLPDDLRYKGFNPLCYVGANFISPSTWQRVTFLFLKFPLGIVSAVLGGIILPFFLIEVMLNVIGLNTGMVTGWLMRAMATGLSGLNSGAVVETNIEPQRRSVRVSRQAAPVSKRKRRPVEDDDLGDDDDNVHMARPVKRKRLEVDDEATETFYIDDDGEIRRRRG